MSTREERLVNLSIRAEAERRDLAAAIAEVRSAVEREARTLHVDRVLDRHAHGGRRRRLPAVWPQLVLVPRQSLEHGGLPGTGGGALPLPPLPLRPVTSPGVGLTLAGDGRGAAPALKSFEANAFGVASSLRGIRMEVLK